MKTSIEKVAGIRSEAVQAKTGKSWAEWFAVLDKAGAQKMAHKDIARYLAEAQGVNDWWSQMVTVGYEQARGLRAKHQKPEGYQISRSKTLKVSAEALFVAWKDGRKRARWLPGAALTIRTATPGKSLRAQWADGQTALEVNLYPKGEAKCQITVQHSRLPSAKAAGKMKTYWGEALERLKTVVEE